VRGRTGPRRASLTTAACWVGERVAGELVLLHAWLDSWSGLGAIVVGMARQGYRLSLTNLTEGEWRAVFSSHPLTSADGFAVARTPWRAVQMAAWAALR